MSVGFAIQRLRTYNSVVLNLQFQLAAYTAVSTGGGNLLGFESANLCLGQQGTHGADGNTVTAGDAIGATDQLIEGSSNLCLEATAGNTDGGLAMELLADIDATLAQNALLGIISKEFVGIIDGVFIADTLKAGLFNTVLIAQILQLAIAVLAAAKAVGLVGGQHQIQHRSSGCNNLLGLGIDHISLSHRGGASCEQLRNALNLHQANPAGCLRGQIFQIT